MQLRPTLSNAASAVLFSVAAICSAQQQPKIANAQLIVRNGDLQQQVQSVQAPSWVGYAIPVTHTVGGDWQDEPLYLEGGEHTAVQYRNPGGPAPWANILLRVVGGRIQKIQIERPDRALDGGGLPFLWVNSVRPADSVHLLSNVVEADSKAETPDDLKRNRSSVDRPMAAIALAEAPEATPALRTFTAATYPAIVRERAAFWLANERDSEGFAIVSAMLRNDKDDALREKLVFDLTLVKGNSRPAAIDQLLATAKSDASIRVRGQAQMWLAQMAGKKAEGDPRIAASLNEQAQSDPNAAIRKSAIFALSRLPEDQGVPELIQVAMTSTDPATKREAIFWLGHAKDPRALAYLEKIVKQ